MGELTTRTGSIGRKHRENGPSFSQLGGVWLGVVAEEKEDATEDGLKLDIIGRRGCGLQAAMLKCCCGRKATTPVIWGRPELKSPMRALN